MLIRLKKLRYLETSHILKSQFSSHLLSGATLPAGPPPPPSGRFSWKLHPGLWPRRAGRPPSPSSEAQVPCTQTALPARPGASRVNLAQSLTGKPRQRACRPWSHKHCRQPWCQWIASPATASLALGAGPRPVTPVTPPDVWCYSSLKESGGSEAPEPRPPIPAPWGTRPLDQLLMPRKLHRKEQKMKAWERPSYLRRR